MIKIISIIIILFAILLTGCQGQSTVNKMNNFRTIKQIIETKNPLIVDIRTPSEYEAGFIEEAINIDLYNRSFFENMKNLPQDRPIIIYCRSGSRTGQAMKGLEGQMSTEVYELEGGIIKWRREGELLVTN